ncbi:N-terminal glutamine amidase-domain-containing protein [Mycena sp. CBHHK59/15]|nr:N-terminal glutamine amidase-domain-containing protein [Mycena sp. CBHHK59/15]
MSDSESIHDVPLLPETIHTPFYCEENIYLLCKAFISQQQDVSAVFISNESKSVALWNQKLVKDSKSAVVWDYHVVLLLRSNNQHWIYDFDTRLLLPSLMRDYLFHTFRKDVPRSYQSLFRIVPGLAFVENFASDRSHMLIDSNEPGEKSYRSPPPCYAALRGRGAKLSNNLMKSFVCMTSSEETFGHVSDLGEMWQLADSAGILQADVEVQ